MREEERCFLISLQVDFPKVIRSCQDCLQRLVVEGFLSADSTISL